MGYIVQRELAENGSELNPDIELAYPNSKILDYDLNLQQNFFGVELFDKHIGLDESAASNRNPEIGTLKLVGENTPTNRSEHRITNMKMVKMIALQLRALHRPGWSDEDVRKYEMNMVDYFQK